MYTVTTKDGSTFVFDSFGEIEEFWNEVVWADGAEDAEVSIRFSNPMNEWGLFEVSNYFKDHDADGVILVGIFISK